MTDCEKIRVLDVRSCRGGGGGPEKTILFSAKEVDRRAFDMSIAYLRSANDPEFDLHLRARGLGVDIVTIDEHRRFDLKAIRRLLELVRTRRIDIFHGHCYKSDLYGLIISRFHPMKLVTTAHGPLASFRFFWASQNWKVRYIYDQIDLRILRYFDLVLMVSDTMRPIISRYGVDDRKLAWVRNAIDSAFFRRSADPSASGRDTFKIPRAAQVVGAVGRLNGEKDYPTFLQAAKLLLARRPNLFFVIVGKGELELSLKTIAIEMGLRDRVLFLGHFHDVRPVYELMDVYVLSSTREGLPNTVLEAMAMEVPIVSTNVDGVLEAVTDGQEALLVPPRDPHQLAGTVERVLNSPDLARRLTTAARLKVEQQFSFAARMRQVEAFYRTLTNAS